jgi:uncharacterized protein YbaR (Trm112 family)
MAGFRELLACPACEGRLDSAWTCQSCGARHEAMDGIPDLRLPGDARTDRVREFYREAPFPNYPPRDSLEALRARAERSEFVRLLDEAIAPDARILEIGCGTGQMSLYLARGERMVIGADLTRASLQLGAAAARRFGVAGVQFVETDLHRPGLRAGAFDVVYAAGVLHHAPDPGQAFTRLLPLLRPGGVIVVGLATAGFRSIRCCATARASLPGTRPGCATSTAIPKSTATAWPKRGAGSGRAASNICAPIPACSWARSRARCSRVMAIIGPWRPGCPSSAG